MAAKCPHWIKIKNLMYRAMQRASEIAWR